MRWLKLWSLSAPPKIKNFMRRALRNCVPTLSNLREKCVNVNSTCPVCRSSVESLEHLLFNCPFSQRCWDLAKMNAMYTVGQSFLSRLSELFSSLSASELELFCSIAWKLWDHRNSVVWKHKYHTPLMIVNGASSFLFMWQQAQVSKKDRISLNNREGVLVWQRPIAGWITCNVDAAVFADQRLSTFGCLVRDEDGTVLAGYCGKFLGNVDPKLAEALAFREALSWLKRMRVSKVFIELDSLGVVQTFNQNPSDSSYFGSIILDCVSIIKDLGSYEVYFVRRSANLTAHTIAREASSGPDHEEWSCVSPFLIDVISSDNQ